MKKSAHTTDILIGLTLVSIAAGGLYLLYQETKDFFYYRFDVSWFMIKLYAISVGLCVISWIFSIYLLLCSERHKMNFKNSDELLAHVDKVSPGSRVIAKGVLTVMDKGSRDKQKTSTHD